MKFFNAAGLSFRYASEAARQNTTNYYVRGEGLTTLQKLVIGVPDSVGRQVPLRWSWNPVGAHSIKAVRKAMEY